MRIAEVEGTEWTSCLVSTLLQRGWSCGSLRALTGMVNVSKVGRAALILGLHFNMSLDILEYCPGNCG